MNNKQTNCRYKLAQFLLHFLDGLSDVRSPEKKATKLVAAVTTAKGRIASAT